MPLLIGERRWIPELESEALLLHRIFLAEKWLVARLHYGHVDPREAGVGNIVNCGAAMYMTPVGIVNAADPDGAYAEAIDVAGAHQSSYGREAAGVFAARRRRGDAARAPRSESVVDAAVDVAHDGTRGGDRSRRLGGGRARPTGEDALGPLRDAVAPFDTVGPHYRQPAMDARRPSRTKSIEELPIALGLVVVAGGDYREAVLGAVNYGRDSDSIATMAGAISGALGGAEAVPQDWLDAGLDGEQTRPRRPGDDTGGGGRRDIWRRDAGAGRGRATPRVARSDDPADVGAARGSRRPRHRRQATRRRATSTTIADRWVTAGGSLDAPHSGATPEPATPAQRDARPSAAR